MVRMPNVVVGAYLATSSRVDSVSVEELCADVAIEPSAFRSLLMHALANEIEAEATCIFLPTRTTRGWEARHLATFGLDGSFSRRLSAFMRRAPPRFACFDPLRPARRDANVVVSLATKVRRAAAEGTPLWHDVLRDADLGDHDQLRLLLCDGREALAVLLAFRRAPFTSAQKRRLSRLTQHLLRRFQQERFQSERDWRGEALAVALDMIGRPALILDLEGRIERANDVAKHALQRDAFVAALRRALDGDRQGWDVQPLRTSNGRHLVMAVQGHETRRAEVQLKATAVVHELSPRQREVLEGVILGRGNKAIANELGCTVKNVEYHVSRLLSRFDVQTRAELSAVVWKSSL